MSFPAKQSTLNWCCLLCTYPAWVSATAAEMRGCRVTGCVPVPSSWAGFLWRTGWGSSGGTHRSAVAEAERGFSPVAQTDRDYDLHQD